MRNLILFIAFIVIFIGCSCTEKYDIDLKDNVHKLVVESLITNQEGPYYVRLTKSYSDFSLVHYVDSLYGYYDKTDTVNAFVLITDNASGLTDTLIHAPDSVWYYYLPDDSVKIRDEFHGGYRGYYQTTTIKGIAGHTYSLSVKWKNLEYHASSYMPSVPDIDSVYFNFTQGEIGKDDYYVPLIYFKEPQNEVNYYLFVTSSGSSVWPYAVLNDEYLNAYVNGLDVFKGVSPDYWMTSYPKPDHPFFIEMHSLTHQAYDFYNSLILQFKNDGGSYSPMPSSPPTNIDNGALGLFRASAVSRIDTTLNSNY